MTIISSHVSVARPFQRGEMAAAQELKASFAYCRRVTRRASKSFALAARLLPPEKRRAIEALYAFARTSDDVVDEAAEPQAALEVWIAQLHGAQAGTNPLLHAWASTCAHFELPSTLADELLAGVGMDLSIDRYATFEQLQLYCYRVASVVGLLAMRIIGHRPGAEAYAIKLGIALQLTNILRDVGEDARRGRIYLPQEDLRRFDVREDEILRGARSDRFRALLLWEIERAEALYQASWPGVALLHPDGQMAVAAAALFYRAILPKIVANDFDVFEHRAYVSLPDKLRLLARIRRQVMALRRGDTRLPELRWAASANPAGSK
jgi:phytoene synthase